MLTLAAADTLAGVASAATIVTSTVFGMELVGTTETYKVLDQRQLASSAATIYTVPASTTTFIRSIHVVNNDTVTRTFQYFRGGTVAANAITPVITLPIGGMAIYEDGQGWSLYNASGQLLSNPQVLGSTTPATVDASAGIAGTSASASAQDHDHQLSVATNAILLGSAAAAGAAVTTLRSNDTIAAFDATAPTTSAVADAAAVGSVAFAARRDHLHGREAFGTAVATTPLALSAAGVLLTEARADHAHQTPGGAAAIVANTAVTNAVTVVTIATLTVPANFCTVGTTFRLTGLYNLILPLTGPTLVCNVKIAGTTAATVTITNNTTAATYAGRIEAWVTVRTLGAPGTAVAGIQSINEHAAALAGSTNTDVLTTTTAITTTGTVALTLELNMGTAVAASTLTSVIGFVEVVKM